jgi:hypothetical protein
VYFGGSRLSKVAKRASSIAVVVMKMEQVTMKLFLFEFLCMYTLTIFQLYYDREALWGSGTVSHQQTKCDRKATGFSRIEIIHHATFTKTQRPITNQPDDPK